MDKKELKHRIKEQIITENYYLSMSMIKESQEEILKHKEKINNLIKEYLDLLN